MKTEERFSARRLYNVWVVTIQFRERVLGGMPRNKELIRTWVEATTGFADEQTEKLIQADADLVVNEVAEKMWIGFPEDEKGLFLHARQIKAGVKQSASILGITKKKRGSKQILAEGLEVKAVGGSDRVYLGQMKPTDTEEKAIHVMTAQGPRTALRKSDFVVRPKIQFEIWALKTAPQESRHIGEEEVIEILTHMQENGLGACRSQGEGKFDVVDFQAVP